MAHFLDNAKLRNNTYKPFLRCISENYSLGFNATPKDEKFCKKKAKGKDECNMQVTDSHAGELIADQWAIQVLGVHAKKNAYTIAQKESLLINSFASLCMTADEGIHPSGDFRIETLLRVNPEISNYLSCNNSKIIKPSCTFDGAVNL